MDNDVGLSPAEVQDLHRLSGIMVPAAEEYGVPAADDPAIFADILASIGRDAAAVKAGLAALAAQGFGGMDDAAAEAAAFALLAAPGAVSGAVSAALGRVVLQCYYRDERVLRSVGHDPRPPFPRGNVVEQGDWSLLEVVKQRPPFWRDDRRA